MYVCRNMYLHMYIIYMCVCASKAFFLLDLRAMACSLFSTVSTPKMQGTYDSNETDMMPTTHTFCLKKKKI